MRAPVGWFERTPLGRILNRFSSDIHDVDEDVMDALGSTLACMFSAASIIVVISYTVGLSGFGFYFGSVYTPCTSPQGKIICVVVLRSALIGSTVQVFIFFLHLLFVLLYLLAHGRFCRILARPQVPFLILALVPISIIAFIIGKRYLNASRELKRLDSVSKSPIYAHFTESVNGVSTM